MARPSVERKTVYVVFAAACLIALISARPFAGGWNDGSRLATVESLVDRHTLAIDDSVFVDPAAAPGPIYESGFAGGTSDKLLIAGRFYSDKSPVPALLMAIAYQVLQWLFGLTAALHPLAFCYWMTLFSSGVAYVAAVMGILQLGRTLQLPLRSRLGITASFALGTLALVYVRYTNNHILLLAVTVTLLVGQVRMAARPGEIRVQLAVGALAGLAYTIDLGVGPPLFLGSVALAAWRTCSPRALALVLLAAAPWLTLHHAVNYAVGGTFKPANAVPEYLAWPGSPFQSNLTGQWNHSSIGHGVRYAVQLLLGKKGFLGHNLPLLLVIPAATTLVRRRSPYLPEIVYCLAVAGGVWLVYAAGSTNYAGACCSIRWFVPLVGLGYFVLIAAWRDEPGLPPEFLILSLGGVALMVSAWPGGPWRLNLLPAYWPIVGLTLVAWAARWYDDRGGIPMRQSTAATLATLILSASIVNAGGDAPKFAAVPLPKDLVAPGTTAVVGATVAFLEGPAADAFGNVYFSDIAGNRILKMDPQGNVRVFRVDSGRTNGNVFDAQGRLISCEGGEQGPGRRRIVRTDLKSGTVTALTDKYEGRRYNSPNDACVDSKERIWFTDPRYSPQRDDLEMDVEGVYRIDPDGKVTRVLTQKQVQRPNGIAVTPDAKTLYVIDSHPKPGGNRKIWSFAVQADGSLAEQRLIFDFGSGRGGDGMKLDLNGNLWVAAGISVQRGPGESLDVPPGVYVISSKGQLLGRIPIPENLITNVCFGGPEHRTLYVTAGKTVYRFPVNVSGYTVSP